MLVQRLSHSWQDAHENEEVYMAAYRKENAGIMAKNDNKLTPFRGISSTTIWFENASALEYDSEKRRELSESIGQAFFSKSTFSASQYMG